MASLQNLLRWMRPDDTMPPSSARNARRYVSSSVDPSPEEFDRRLVQHDQEMQMIEEIVASIRQERRADPGLSDSV